MILIGNGKAFVYVTDIIYPKMPQFVLISRGDFVKGVYIDFVSCKEDYKIHLEKSKEVVRFISSFFANKGQGCTVSINDNLHIEVIYKIPRNRPQLINQLRKKFRESVVQFCEENDFVEIYYESSCCKDYRLTKPFQYFYTEKSVLDINGEL